MILFLSRLTMNLELQTPTSDAQKERTPSTNKQLVETLQEASSYEQRLEQFIYEGVQELGPEEGEIVYHLLKNFLDTHRFDPREVERNHYLGEIQVYIPALKALEQDEQTTPQIEEIHQIAEQVLTMLKEKKNQIQPEDNSLDL